MYILARFLIRPSGPVMILLPALPRWENLGRSGGGGLYCSRVGCLVTITSLYPSYNLGLAVVLAITVPCTSQYKDADVFV